MILLKKNKNKKLISCITVLIEVPSCISCIKIWVSIKIKNLFHATHALTPSWVKKNLFHASQKVIFSKLSQIRI